MAAERTDRARERGCRGWYEVQVDPPIITERTVATNGVELHVLEAGEGSPVVLCHGFPELGYSWRHQLPVLAGAGYHAIAPDQRGYGRTTGWDADYDGDLAGFRFMNLLRDAIGVLFAIQSLGSSIGPLVCGAIADSAESGGKRRGCRGKYQAARQRFVGAAAARATQRFPRIAIGVREP